MFQQKWNISIYIIRVKASLSLGKTKYSTFILTNKKSTVYICDLNEIKTNQTLTNKSCHLRSGPSDWVGHVRFCPGVQHHPRDVRLSWKHMGWIKETNALFNKSHRRIFLFHCVTSFPRCGETHRTGRRTWAPCSRARARYSWHRLRVAAAACTCRLFLCRRRAWGESSRTVDKTKLHKKKTLSKTLCYST